MRDAGCGCGGIAAFSSSAFCILHFREPRMTGPVFRLPSPARLSSPWNPLGHGRQWRELRERRRLIPVRGREEVVAAIVGVAVLHRVLQRAFERDGVVAVPAIAAIAAAGTFRR